MSLTFGEKAVGIQFNPSNDETVHAIKTKYAEIINLLHDMRNHEEATSEKKRYASVAITEAQTAQMWAVKAATWRDQ